MSPRILSFAGSLRTGSWNKKLARVAADAARAAGAEATFVDLRDFPMPVFDEDAERKDGAPEGAKKLKALFLSHHGLLISCPEYNSSITAALKNALDWVSRGTAGEAPLAAYSGKVAGLLAASPGALGGIRGLVHVRAILGNLGVLVLPEQVAVMKAHEAFDGDGRLKDPKQAGAVSKLAESLARTIAKLTA